ncbi:hypothetical protein B484DRAFT_434571, partial [Ochromonadaceae sp. CCMP2298]
VSSSSSQSPEKPEKPGRKRKASSKASSKSSKASSHSPLPAQAQEYKRRRLERESAQYQGMLREQEANCNDRRGKSVKVILKYHSGSEQMCRKWYLKRLDIPAAEGVPAIPGYMQSLSNNVTFADIYIADFAPKFCMYAHLTELLMEALAQQSEINNQEVAGDDDEEAVDELEEPDV